MIKRGYPVLLDTVARALYSHEWPREEDPAWEELPVEGRAKWRARAAVALSVVSDFQMDAVTSDELIAYDPSWPPMIADGYPGFPFIR